MAFVAEAVARLRLDTSDFQRGLTRTTADVGRAGDDMGRKLKRAFGAGDVFRGLLMGVGIGSVHQVVDLLTKGWERAAESAKKIADLTAETADIYAKIFSSRRGDQENLVVNRRDQARLQRELGTTTEQREEREMLVGGGTGVGPTKVKGFVVTRKDNPERRAEIAKELAQLAAEEEILKRRIAAESKKAGEDEAKAMKEYYDAAQDRAKKLAERKEKVAQDEQDFARLQMSAEERIAALKRDQLAIDYLLAAGAITALDAREKTLAVEKEMAKALDEQAREQERIGRERDDERRKQKESERNAKRILDAGRGVTDARADYATQLRDRSGFTVAEAAAGQAGNATERAKARQVLSWESRSRRVRGLTDYRDAQGNRADPGVAADSMNRRANAIRESIGGLISSEKYPMANASKAIVESEKHLAAIVKELTATDVSGGPAAAGKGKGPSLVRFTLK